MVSKAELIEFTSHSEYIRPMMLLIQQSNRVRETTNTTDKFQG